MRYGVLLFLILWGGWLFAENGATILGYSNGAAPPEEFRYVYLKFIKTHDIVSLLPGICEDCRWVVSHSRQTVGVTASKKRWALYRRAIQRLDHPTPQVSLAIDIIEVSNIQSERYQQVLSQLSRPLVLDQPLQSTIQMMVSSGNATIVSSPKLMGVSGQPIVLAVGERVPYTSSVQSNGYQSTQLNYIDSGVSLTLIPHVHYNSDIDLAIELSYDTISGYRSEGGVDLPIIATRKSNVHIHIQNNQTVMFTGLLDTSNHVSIEKVPFLGDIPMIGGFFRRKITQKKTTDLIYKVTPQWLN
jgi:type II secretory pathway component GspD/PulD (secretin)